MTASTADRPTSIRQGAVQYGLLAASALVLAGCLICRDASGNLVDGEDASALDFAGIARAGVDNSDGDAGDVGVEYYVAGQYKLGAAGLAAGDEGKPVFLLDNQTVVLGDNAGLTNRIYVGRIAEVISATSCWVRIEPQRSEAQQFTVEVAGVNTDDFDLSSAAAAFGGTDFHILAVTHVAAFVTSSGNSAGRKVATTHWSLAAGVLSAVGDETLNTWVITFIGILK